MMNPNVVSRGAAASGYYNAEGYYASGSKEAEASASWFGKGAEALGLRGSVDDQVFAQILDGQSFKNEDGTLTPDRLMGKIVDGERAHRPGVDLTFKAPKSVSIAALVYEDERVIEAHDKAVKQAMSYVEENLTLTRQKENGELVVRKGLMISSLFRHDTSRSLDPHLHTHAIVANMVLNDSGRHTALHNNEIFEQQKIVSEIYRNALAVSLKDLGYTVNRVGRDKLIELGEVPKELVSQFSKRTEQIDRALKERGLESNPKTRELAALATRAAKDKSVDRSELKRTWEREAEELGLSREKLSKAVEDVRVKGRNRLPGVTRGGVTDGGVNGLMSAISHLSERRTVFSHNDLLQDTLRFSGMSSSQATTAIELKLSDGQLLDLGKNGKGQQLYTTKELIEVEKAVLKAFRHGAKRGGLDPSVEIRGRSRTLQSVVEQSVGRETLSEGQKDAIRVSLLGSSQVVGMQGHAGTGKTYAMSELKKITDNAGYELLGFAPSRKAVEELKEAIPNSMTIQSLLVRQGPKSESNPDKQIWVVDESSMLDTKQMLGLMELSNKLGVRRVVLSGDVKQLDAVGAGTPFQLLQDNGMPTAKMTDIIRQRNETLRMAVVDSIKGEIPAAFTKIGPDIRESDLPEQTAADAYLALSPNERANVGIITPSNKTRVAINLAVRSGLRDEGAIGNTDVKLVSLEPLRLTRAEAASSQSYEEGDVVLSHTTNATAGLKKGSRYHVTSVDKKSIGLQNTQTGELTKFTLSQTSRALKSIEVFTETERSFAVGEAVKFRITDNEHGISNGDKGKIVAINEKAISIAFSSGREVEVPSESLAAQGMDQAYALTGHDMQGATVDHVIVVMKAEERLADQKSFYVGISRARESASLVTNNAEKLADRIADQTGEAPHALIEHLRTVVPNHSAIQERNHTDAQERNRTDTQERNRTDTQEHNHTDTQEHNHTDAQEHNRTDTQEHNHTDTQEHNHTDAQEHNRTAAQEHNRTDAQEHNQTVEDLLKDRSADQNIDTDTARRELLKIMEQKEIGERSL
jgi:conjugative relaxase-like TrwC/TraI family protein